MSEGLAQGPYVAARVGFEPATFRTQGTELPRPINDDKGLCQGWMLKLR